MAPYVVLFTLFVLLSPAFACDRCVHQSQTAYTSEISSGSCGYNELALEFNNGLLASGLPSLFDGGAGCGACFKVRCTNLAYCKNESTAVIMTERQGDPRIDLLLNRKAYVAMARDGMEQQLLNLGIVGMEYKRVPCNYSRNLALRVEDYSNRPYYLAVLILYQGGQTQILSVDVAAVQSTQWTSMTRNHGAVWDTNQVPEGPLKFRFLVTSGYDGRWYTTQQVLPTNWQAGVTYDSGIQIDDIAQETCDPCDNTTW